MKKYLLFVIFLSLLILFSQIVIASHYPPCDTPSSGYAPTGSPPHCNSNCGGVMTGGDNQLCFDCGISDGLCPEHYADVTGRSPTCGNPALGCDQLKNCDPDCRSCAPPAEVCTDGTDNDCDGAIDCSDSDCAGKTGPGGSLCCQTAANCVQDDCVVESCVDNKCRYANRNACDSTECAVGRYCDASVDCKTPDESSSVCVNCITDQTSGLWTWNPANHQDAGKAYSTNIDVYSSLFNSNGVACSAASGGNCFDSNGNPINHKSALASGNCCGDDANEFYKPDYYAGECTSNVNDCVWSTGDAQASNTGNAKWWCYLHEWNECKDSTICSKAGGVTCAGTASSNAWTPNSLVKPENQYSCTDSLDNDCDGSADCKDIDCASQADCAITLTLTPNPAEIRSTITASVTGRISGEVFIKDYRGCSDASAQTICSFTTPATSCTFTSPALAGSYGYWACASLQKDTETLTVVVPPSHCSTSSSHQPGEARNTGTYSHVEVSGSWNVENCATKTSVDSDGSSTTYTIQGTVIDYTGCLDGICTSNTYSDSCAGTILTEYGASGSSFVSSTYECQNFEKTKCFNDRFLREEWGCSGVPGYCNDAAVADTPIGINADNDAKDKECGDSLCDNAANVYDATKTATEGACSDSLDNDCDGLKDCADNDCNGIAPCCTNIARECKTYSREQFELIHKSYYKEGQSLYYDAILKQIKDNSYYSCPINAADTSCCASANSCVYNGDCYPDGHRADIDDDGVIERCVATSPGQWIDEFEIDCGNGIDDDLDGLTDCDDPDCAGSITGTVKNQNNQEIASADVNAKKDLATVASATTNQQGNYNIPSINCGNYNLIASHADYAPQTKNIGVLPNQQSTVDFELVLGTSCEPDCTFAADNIIHASCDGKNGCGFYDSIARAACDNSQPGWIRDYNASHYVACASGSPQPKVEIQASVSCASGTLIKVTRIVLYNGKPVKLVVATCG